jgi:prepilin-type N-terminal cleavage/methylation domain-containing protein
MKTATRPRAGFSLVEILVAAAILLVIGGATASLLMRAFTLWEHGVAATRRLAATDAFVTQLSRDFAATPSGLGFTGTMTRCRFWTLEVPAAALPRLAAVEYTLTPQAILRRAVTAGAADTREARYAPVEPLIFRFGAPDAADDVWQKTWSAPTNAPARLLLQARARTGGACFPHLLLRRTP